MRKSGRRSIWAPTDSATGRVNRSGYEECESRARHTKDVTYFFDKQSGMPLKIASLYHRDGRDIALMEWEVVSLEKVQGHYFPISSKTTSYRFSKSNSDNHMYYTIKSHFDKIVFNKTYSASSFRPIFQPGVIVRDWVRKKSYTVPGGSKKDAQSRKSDVLSEGGREATVWSLLNSESMLLVIACCVVLAGTLLRFFKKL